MEKNKTKILAGTAIFTALSYLVSFLEFPVFTATPFLKIDFSSVFTLLSGFAFGPISAVIVIAVKELLRFITVSSTGGVGELANFLATFSFVIVPSVVYTKFKGIKVVIITMLIGCLLQTLVATICNRFIMFPLYMGDGAKQVFDSVFVFIVLFNIIKSVTVSVITFLLYKRISRFISRF